MHARQASRQLYTMREIRGDIAGMLQRHHTGGELQNIVLLGGRKETTNAKRMSGEVEGWRMRE